MLRTLLVIALLMLVPGLAFGNYLGDIQFDRGDQAWLAHSTRVNVSFSYHVTEPGGARIMVLPYTDGHATPGYAWAGSPLYAAGYDTGSSWFRVTAGEYVVDHVQVSMWDSSFSTLLLELFVPVEYHYAEFGISDLAFSHSQPSWLPYGEDLLIDHDYVVPVECLIFARPFCNGHLCEGYGASGGEHALPPGGSAGHYFTFFDGTKDVDAIRFQFKTMDQSELLYEFFVPVDYHWWSSHGLMNFSLDPESPQWLAYPERVTGSFDYATDDPNGVRIWLLGARDGAIVTSNIVYQASDNMPAPGGAISRYFRYSADTSINQVCALMRNNDQTETYLEVFIPAPYEYRAHAVNRVALTPGAPAILDFEEDITVDFSYYTTGANQVYIWPHPFSNGSQVTPHYYGGSPLYDPPSGVGDNYFGCQGPDDVLVDQVQMRMRDATNEEILVEAYTPACHFYGRSGIISTAAPVPPVGATALLPNFPNPFNPKTTLRFVLGEASHARLAVFDVQGRLVRELVNEPLAAGVHDVVWDGADAGGRKAASGIYLAKLTAGASSQTRKMILIE